METKKGKGKHETAKKVNKNFLRNKYILEIGNQINEIKNIDHVLKCGKMQKPVII